MKTPTFEEQYQKIVSAYYKNQLDPFNDCACFIGNLLNSTNMWSNCRKYGKQGKSIILQPQDEIEIYFWKQAICSIKKHSNGLYDQFDILNLENNFLSVLTKNSVLAPDGEREISTEEDLFLAMQSTLEMLRKIHESKGEVVKDYNFTKRELV